jgi:hypothetical protein
VLTLLEGRAVHDLDSRVVDARPEAPPHGGADRSRMK